MIAAGQLTKAQARDRRSVYRNEKQAVRQGAKVGDARKSVGTLRGTQAHGDRYHDNCRCIAVAVRPGQAYEPPGYVQQWEKDYAEASRGTKGIGAIGRRMESIDKERQDAANEARGTDATPAGETAPGVVPPIKEPPGLGATSSGDGNDDRMRLDAETRNWAAGLSPDHRAAVRRWQGTDRFYEQVQLAYQGEIEDEEAIDVADKLLEVVTHPLAAEYTVWRGVRSAAATFGVDADQLDELIDSTAPLNRFLATSLDRSVAIDEFTKPQLRGGAVLIEMTLKPGVRVGWIPPIGDPAMASQQELLLHPNMVQRIVGVDRSGPVVVVRMEVTPS